MLQTTPVQSQAPDSIDLKKKEKRYTYQNVTCHVKSATTNNVS